MFNFKKKASEVSTKLIIKTIKIIVLDKFKELTIVVKNSIIKLTNLK